ncbi:MAG: hypothetical protein K9L02_07630 [Acholeplasmataceae bacterium]|nr:hypothetical protein [Acholeplasmataceae bacterium]
MARVQTSSSKTKSNTNTKNKAPQKSVVVQKTGMKASPKKEPSKNEIMFFRIGMWAIALTIVVVSIVLLVQHFMTEEEVVPFDDYLHVTVSDLKYITQQDIYGVYGDFSYFDGKDQYEDLRAVLNSNDFVYVYFYRSSDLNLDIKAAIEALVGLEDMAFLFVDLDLADSAGLFTTAEIAHLNLDETKDNMFLIFDINAQSFQLETRVSDILIEINKL